MAVEHHSEPAPEITPAQLRQIIENEVEHLIGALDFIDPDPDLEPECEDEGAQCDDEGWDEPDCGNCEDEGFIRHYDFGSKAWREAQAAQERTARAAQAQIDSLRRVMKRHGLTPVEPLRVLGGAIIKL